MAKWTGKIRTVKRWFRSPKFLVEMKKEDGDHNPPDCPELYWEKVDALRLDLIAFDLQCRRNEVEVLTAENARLREKLINVGSDTKLEVTMSSESTAEDIALSVKEIVMQTLSKNKGFIRSTIQAPDIDNKTLASCKSRFLEGSKPFTCDLPPASSLPRP